MNDGKAILPPTSSRQIAFGLSILCLTSGSAQALSLGEIPSLSVTGAARDERLKKEDDRLASPDQGQEISINGRKYPVAWRQWQAETLRTGISDTGAMQFLGLELLSTQNSSKQPIQYYSRQPLSLTTQFLSPYRYIDITDLAASTHWQLQTRGTVLDINFTPARILNIRQGQQDWGQRIVLDLDRPVPWQVSQTTQEGVVMVEGVILEEAVAAHQDRCLPSPCPITVEKLNGQVKLRVQLPEGKGLRAFSLANPNRLVVDVRSDTLVERDIRWGPGMQWRQQYVTPDTRTTPSPRSFPVTWLEIALSETTLQPITSDEEAAGIAPLLNIARAHQVSAAVNGGFFNRNNQLPLGAIRYDGRWLSGPILNRGAIAWNNQGAVKIARLRLQEVLTTSSGDRLRVLFLNSGYVKAGLSRYTREWGASYTPLTDRETVLWIQDGQVTQKQPLGIAGQHRVDIPKQGYILVARGEPLSSLSVGTEVNLDSQTVPAELSAYPHVIGAGPLLLQNRQVVLNSATEQFAQAFDKQAASRSAIGTTNQGTVVIAAVHSSSTGKGPTLPELASIMQRLGAVDALNLDGGSSTGLYLGGQLLDRSPSTAARVHNGIGIMIR